MPDTGFILKTMLVLFGVPLLSNMGVDINLKSASAFVQSRFEQTQGPSIDHKELQAAVAALKKSVDEPEFNGESYIRTASLSSGQAGNSDQKMRIQMVLNNIGHLAEDQADQ